MVLDVRSTTFCMDFWLKMGFDNYNLKISSQIYTIYGISYCSQEDDDAPAISQGSSTFQSSGSLYLPSQESAASFDSIGKMENFYKQICIHLSSGEVDSETETDGANIDGSFLIVPWTCILLLLSKCQRHGCAEPVLPSNVKVSRKGTTNNCR